METTSQDESESDEQDQPLEAKPLRSLAPMLPLPMKYDVATQSTDPMLVFVTPFRPCTSPEPSAARQPLPKSPAPLRATPVSAAFPMPRPGAGGDPLEATPVSAAAPAFRMPRREDESSEEEYNPFFCGRKKPTRLKTAGKRTHQQAECSNARDMKRRPTQTSLSLNKELATFTPSSSSDPTESVQETLTMFDSLRRRILQLDENREDAAGKRADLKAGSLMMQNGLRINNLKTVGPVPGVEVGDIFFFRMEMCVVGLHAPAMAGIDYVSARRGGSGTDEVVAVSVVSSGGYENDDTDSDVLVYTGQGGSSRRRKDKHDQRLERGNLALMNSMERRSVVRVVRGAQDPFCRSSKIYVYDGLYRVEGSWTERARDGFSVFKYKLRREPGQRDGISVWKMAERWRADPVTRSHVVSADMSSSAEKLPVCLVNDTDDDDEQRVPGRFNYVTGVEYEYPRPLGKTKPCKCPSVCLPSDDPDCSCARLNSGHLPYTACGLLVKRVPVLYECGPECRCSGNCRNRVAQKGVRLRFEVFWTGDACGWGVRSWDPIRAGAFVCEYAGQAVDVSTGGEEDEYAFCASGEGWRWWNLGAGLVEEASDGDAAENLEERLPVMISARRSGNVARFLNHSCSPNLLWQPVRYGDGGYPHVMFFAMRHVPPMAQLTYDYGTTRGAAPPGFQGKFPNACRLKPCFCGSTSCRGSF